MDEDREAWTGCGAHGSCVWQVTSIPKVPSARPLFLALVPAVAGWSLADSVKPGPADGDVTCHTEGNGALLTDTERSGTVRFVSVLMAQTNL